MLARLMLCTTAALAVAAQASAQTFSVAKNNIGGTGAFDYLAADPGTGRVFVSRSTHVMVVDGVTGKQLGDITNTPGVHGAAFSHKSGHGFTTNGGDSTVTMFDLASLAEIKRIETHTGGLDGIAYDEFTNRIFTENHSRPEGSSTAIDAAAGTVVGAITLDGTPEGAVSDGKGRMYVNIESKSEIQVFDATTLKSIAIWPLDPCDSPSGLAIDKQTMRLFSACSNGMTAVMDATNGKIVAKIPIGDGPDAIGFDSTQKLIYTPAGGGRGASAKPGGITVAHEDSPDSYTVIANVSTMTGARTIAVDPVTHNAYTFNTEYGPPPAGAAAAAGGTGGGAAAGAGAAAGGRGGRGGGRGRGPTGPLVGAWLFVITHQ